MHIRSFHIDAFGVLRDLTVTSLPPGTSVFLGRNEAGKSTLLDFLRSVLAGYPRTRGGRDRAYISGTGQILFGGSLELDTGYGIVHLTRRPGKDGGQPVLIDADGNLLDSALWERMLGGVGREVYASVYGFSLRELQDFQSLSSEGVRNALYGASFGMGLRSPGMALKKLDSLLEGLFKIRGSSQKISRAFSEWEEIRRRIRDFEGGIAQYDALARKIEAFEARLSDLAGERKKLEQERYDLERRLGVWKQWEEWRLAGIRVERLEPVPLTFPQDGPARLERALERQADAERERKRAKEREEQVRVALETCQVDERLLEAGEAVRRLAEGTSSCRNALAVLPELCSAQNHLKAELERELKALGDGWSLERVQRTERPLAFREELERQAEALRTAELEFQNASTICSRLERELETARAEEEKIREQLSRLPDQVSVLDESERELLRARIVHIEALLRERPAREQACRETREGLERGLRQLGLDDGTSLDTLSEAQQEIGRRSARLREAEERLLRARRSEELAEGAEERQGLRVNDLRQKRLALGACDSTAVESRRSALRELRSVLGKLHIEEGSASEAEDRLSAHLAESSGLERSPVLIVFGVLLAAGGIGLGILPFLGLEALGGVPQTPWLAVLFVFAGGAFIWSGALRRRPEAVRHAAEAERLRERYGQRVLRCQELRQQAERLCQELFPSFVLPSQEDDGIQKVRGKIWPDERDLDRLEAELEQERDRCRTAGLLDRELNEAEEELRTLRAAARSAQNECSGLAVQLESLEREWKAFFAELGVSRPPRADDAAAFCTRADAARLVLRSAEERQHALDQGNAQISEFMDQIVQLRSRMGAALGPDNEKSVTEETVTEAGQILLRVCSEADRIEAERTRLIDESERVDLSRQRLEQEEQENLHRLREAERNRDEAERAWSRLLMRLGLTESGSGDVLPPETARQVLESMDRIQRLEADRHRLEVEQQRQERERDAVLLPLRDMLITLQRLPDEYTGTDEKDMPDSALSPESGMARSMSFRMDEHKIFALMDELIRDTEQARLAAEEHKRLQLRLAELVEEHHRADAVADDARLAVEKLLKAAEALDPEDFLRRHAIRQERETVLRRREELEDMLRLAASDALRDGKETSGSLQTERLTGMDEEGKLSETAFKEFLDGFAELRREELEARQLEVSGRLTWMDEEYSRLDDELRTMKVRMENQVSSDVLQRDRMESSRVAENIQELAREWSKYALARRLLVEARNRFERERQPEVIRIASRLFSDVTGGKWNGISASLEDSSLHVLTPHGEPVDPEVLSRGTQEQLYLALRLAHIRSHAVQKTSLPVIMDDVLVNFDPERAERTARVLGEMNRENESGPGHQLLFFTCHPQTVHLLQRAIPDSKLYLLENGRISSDGYCE